MIGAGLGSARSRWLAPRRVHIAVGDGLVIGSAEKPFLFIYDVERCSKGLPLDPDRARLELSMRHLS